MARVGRWKQLMAAGAFVLALAACGDGATSTAEPDTTRVVPDVLPPGLEVYLVHEETPQPGDMPDAPFTPERLVWFELRPTNELGIGIAVLDAPAASDDLSAVMLEHASSRNIGGRPVAFGAVDGGSDDVWLTRVARRTWVLLSRPSASAPAVSDDVIAAVIGGLRLVDEASWTAYVQARSSSTTTTTMDPIVASSGASGPGGPTGGPSGIDCMRTAAVLPAALRLWPEPMPAGAHVTVSALGPACNDTTTITIVPLGAGRGPTGHLSIRIIGSGAPAPTYAVPPSASSETVSAGARTIQLRTFVLGGDIPGASGSFVEAGRVVAFDASGVTKADLVAILASLRPATVAEWTQAGGRA